MPLKKFKNHWNIHITHYGKSIILLFYYIKPHVIINLWHLNFNIFSHLTHVIFPVLGITNLQQKWEGMEEL